MHVRLQALSASFAHASVHVPLQQDGEFAQTAVAQPSQYRSRPTPT